MEITDEAPADLVFLVEGSMTLWSKGGSHMIACELGMLSQELHGVLADIIRLHVISTLKCKPWPFFTLS